MTSRFAPRSAHALGSGAGEDHTDGRRTVVTARAPLRVSLAGGGTDLPSYARRHGGSVVSIAIDRYVGVTVYPRSFDGSLRTWLEAADHVPDAAALRNPYAKAALKRSGVHSSAQLSSFSDIPSGTGLGSSAAFTVSLLHALHHHRRPDPGELAEAAAAIEMEDLRRPVGKHDHYMAAYGGLRLLRIGADLSVEQQSLPVPAALAAYIRDDLLLFHTGITRDAAQVLAAQSDLTERNSSGTVGSLRAIHALAEEMRRAVLSGSVRDIGPLLHEHWTHKTRLSPRVSSDWIDGLYRKALGAGADGGKVLGAGGGGFLLLSCRPGRAADLRTVMRSAGLRELAFDLDPGGSQAGALGI
ncbi:hypothetical protein [Streptomyces naphthomycinicus]|uniref:GHMP family kinase ATP-binding protein n=1 Tax=Streptomyces naphthomycinicus TaxID=2872625 RepID=UPI001CED498A|nr:hypothetical protein [Streptomyces sp. TML10]